MQYAERAVQIDPNYDVAYLSKIRNLRRLRRYNEAVKTANEALTIFPNHAELLYYRGFLFWSMRRFSEAIKDLDKVLELTDGLDQNALFRKARCLEDMGNFDEAIKVYEACYKIGPTTTQGQDSLYRKSTLKARTKVQEKKEAEEIETEDEEE